MVSNPSASLLYSNHASNWRSSGVLRATSAQSKGLRSLVFSLENIAELPNTSPQNQYRQTIHNLNDVSLECQQA